MISQDKQLQKPLTQLVTSAETVKSYLTIYSTKKTKIIKIEKSPSESESGRNTEVV
jgi:hypothetical protein